MIVGNNTPLIQLS